MIKRTIFDSIIKSINNRPVTLITGARQVGKSTLCKELVRTLNFNYVSLDNIRERKTAIEDPELFLQLHKFPLIIDEVQYAPNLFEVIEQIVNEKKFQDGNNYGMFVLISSKSYMLMEGVSQSMAGRVSIINMSPLSMNEINVKDELPFVIDPILNSQRINDYKININDLFSHIVKGFYPELYDNDNLDYQQFYSDYVDTYINKDVSQIIKLNDKLKFQNFLEILASLTGEELVYDTISKAIGVSIPTIKSWISVLLAGDIITLLEPYNEKSNIKRVVKRPKIYFNDTGLACYLARLNSPEMLQKSIFAGRFMETYIINEIIKSYKNNGKKAYFYYYRDTNQNEIDLVILDDGILHFVECKMGVEFSRKDVSSFDILRNKTNYKVGNSCIICNSLDLYKIDKDVYVLPVSVI